jgi:MFS superfamily sulfate permease-like transporter
MDTQTITTFALGLSLGVMVGMVIAHQIIDAEMCRRRDEAGEREERWYGHIIDPEQTTTHGR